MRIASWPLVALAFLLACSPASAEPAISTRTRAAEITVTIDPRLDAHPGLAANLLAEARRSTGKRRADAEKEFKTDPSLFRDGQRWTYGREYKQRSVVGRYVSVLRTDDTYSGGAHPNSLIDTILWDREAGKRVSIRPLFSETADNGPTLRALARLVRRAVAVAKIARGTAPENLKNATPDELAAKDDWITQGIKPTLLKLGPVSLAPSTVAGKSSGLTFHFPPYMVDAYAAGDYTVFVPWEEFKPHLSADGATLFAGARPKEDETEQEK
jgi:hypothetical protein